MQNPNTTLFPELCTGSNCIILLTFFFFFFLPLFVGGTSCEAQVFKITVEDGVFCKTRPTQRSSTKFSCFKVSRENSPYQGFSLGQSKVQPGNDFHMVHPKEILLTILLYCGMQARKALGLNTL